MHEQTHTHTNRLERLEGQLAVAKKRQAAAEDSLNVTIREQALEAEVSYCDGLEEGELIHFVRASLPFFLFTC